MRGRACDSGAVADIGVSTTLDGGALSALVRAVLDHSDTRTDDVAIRVKRHGIRRAYFTACSDPRCRLVGTTEDYEEGPARGRGHLYARRGDLSICRSAAPITPVDRTSHWVTGRAYDGVPYPRSVPRGTRYVVTVKVPQVRPEGLLPADRTYHRAKRAGATRIETPADDIVFVLAHELHHVHQFRDGLPRSEVDAERVGREVLRAWITAGRPGAGSSV